MELGNMYVKDKTPETLKNFQGQNFYITLKIYIGEGNGTPLQYSCLENPMGGGAW